jgi:hypothetical protein
VARKRPLKLIRINGWKKHPDYSAGLAIYAMPSEARLFASPNSFISVNSKSITLSPGTGGIINLQTLPQNIRYGGMLMDLPFPMSIMPATPVTPFPKQIFVPPFLELLPQIRELAQLSSFFVGMTTGF